MTVKGPFNTLVALAFWKRSPGTKWLEGLVNPALMWTCSKKKNFCPANSTLLVENGPKTFPWHKRYINHKQWFFLCLFSVGDWWKIHLAQSLSTITTVCFNNMSSDMVAEEGCLNKTYIVLDAFMSLKAFCCSSKLYFTLNLQNYH